MTQAELEKALEIACVGRHFVLWESSSARAWHYSKVEAAKHAVVMRHSEQATINGGRVLEMHTPHAAATQSTTSTARRALRVWQRRRLRRLRKSKPHRTCWS